MENRLSLHGRESWLILLFIIFIGLLLRLPNLDESLWYDELWSTHIKLGSLKSLALTSIKDIHPPFYSVFMFLWIQLLGDSEIAVRMPPFIFGIASIFLTYVIARQLAENKVALLAAFLLSLSPVHIWYSQEARPYSALMFLLLLSITAYLKLKEAQAKRAWSFLYLVSMLACVMTHYYLSAYLVIISLLAVVGRHTHKRRILLMNGLILSCFSLWLVLKVALTNIKTGEGYLRAFTFTELWQLFFNWFLLGNSWNATRYYWVILIVQVFSAILLARGVVSLWRQSASTESTREIILYLLILPLSLLLFTVIGFTNYIERSLFVAMPFFFMVIARGATGFEAKSIRYACILLVVLTSAVSVAGYFKRQDVWTVYKPNPDWRSMARYLEDETNHSLSKPLILTITPADELTYYNPRFKQLQPYELDAQQKTSGKSSESEAGTNDGTLVVYRIGKDRTEKIYPKLAEDDTQRFYLIHNKYWSASFKNVFEELSNDPRFRYQAMQSFKGLEVHRFSVVMPQAVARRSPDDRREQ